MRARTTQHGTLTPGSSDSDAEPEDEANVPGRRAPRSSVAAGAYELGGGALDLTIRGSAVLARPTADGEYDIMGNPIGATARSDVQSEDLMLDARCAGCCRCRWLQVVGWWEAPEGGGGGGGGGKIGWLRI